jgi:hypothetical protein
MGNLFATEKSLETIEEMDSTVKVGDWIFKLSWNVPLFVVNINLDNDNSSNYNESIGRTSRKNGPKYTVYEFDTTSHKVSETVIIGSKSFWMKSQIGVNQTHVEEIIEKCKNILEKKQYVSFKSGYEAIIKGKILFTSYQIMILS